MLDPHAPLATHVALPQGTHLAARTGRAAGRPGDSPALMGSLAALLDAFDFGREHRRPQVPLQRLVALEIDVPSFSAGPQAGHGVPAEHQGGLLQDVQPDVDTHVFRQLHALERASPQRAP